MQIDRRIFCGGLPFVSFPTLCFAATTDTGWQGVLNMVMQAAAKYVLGQAMGTDAPPMSGEAIVGAIQASLNAVEAHLKEDFRKALTQDQIRSLSADAKAISADLSTFSKLLPIDRPHYRFMLERAYGSAGTAIENAYTLNVAGLPIFAVLVGLRTQVIAAMMHTDGQTSLYDAYRPQLIHNATRLDAGLDTYEAAIQPDARLTEVTCFTRHDRGRGFKVDGFFCRFDKDGTVFSGIPRDVNATSDQIRATTTAYRDRQIRLLTQERDENIATFIAPLRDTAMDWRKLAKAEPRI